MKKSLLIITFFLIIVGGFFLFSGDSSSSKDIKNYPSEGTNIIAFGDSLVSGVGSSSGNDFVSLLSRKLDVPIENFGKAGDTTSAALVRLDKILERDPKIVLLLLGGNDYLRRISKEETFSNLGTIIESIQERGAIVVLLGVRGGLLKDNYKNDFRDLSLQYQTAYISNVLDDLIGDPDLMYDGIHPNDAGYKIIADRIYPVIKDLIE